MKLNTFTLLAMRVIKATRVHPFKVTIKEMSDKFGANKNHLMKVVSTLSKHGYVSTIRGKHGGVVSRDTKKDDSPWTLDVFLCQMEPQFNNGFDDDTQAWNSTLKKSVLTPLKQVDLIKFIMSERVKIGMVEK